MDSDNNDPQTLCPKCQNFVRTQNYLIHEARCQGPTSIDRSRASSRIFNSRPSTSSSQISKQSSQINQRQQQQQRIPCPFCGYGQTLLQLDTHPKTCAHREQQCQSCKNKFPRSLMEQHMMFCPANRRPNQQNQRRQPIFEQNQNRRPQYNQQQFNQNRRPQYYQQQQFSPQRRPQYPQQYAPQMMQRRPNDPFQLFNMILGDMMQRRQPQPTQQRRQVLQFQDLGALIHFLAGHGMQQQQHGLSKQDIRQFPVTKYTLKNKKQEEEPDKCIICYCNFEEGEDCMKLPCTHEFHPQCVGTWLQKNPTCPVCKHNFGPQMPEEQVQRPPRGFVRVFRF